MPGSPPRTWLTSPDSMFRSGRRELSFDGMLCSRLNHAVTRSGRQQRREECNFMVLCFSIIIVFRGPETRGRFLAPTSGPVSGQGRQPGNCRVPMRVGVGWVSAVAENGLSFWYRFFWKKQVRRCIFARFSWLTGGSSEKDGPIRKATWGSHVPEMINSPEVCTVTFRLQAEQHLQVTLLSLVLLSVREWKSECFSDCSDGSSFAVSRCS